MDSADPTRIAFHADQTISNTLPIILELAPTSNEGSEGDIPLIDWLKNVSALFVDIF